MLVVVLLKSRFDERRKEDTREKVDKYIREWERSW